MFAYSTNEKKDTVTQRLQSLVDHWIFVAGTSDVGIRERIEADGIDVLIDLSGHTGLNRLGVFARRAAPVQAHYLGYFASTGLSEMDYWIGDDIVTPIEMEHQFSERIWRLPRVWVSYKTVLDAPEPDWRPADDGSIWIGSFNNLGKLTPATLALWGRVLAALPEGKLLLKSKELADAGNRQRILNILSGHGVSPERIDLQPGSNWVDYMAQYNRLDIALDPVGGSWRRHDDLRHAMDGRTGHPCCRGPHHIAVYRIDAECDWSPGMDSQNGAGIHKQGCRTGPRYRTSQNTPCYPTKPDVGKSLVRCTWVDGCVGDGVL
ncbi:MAG: hypothetical protein WDM70_06150 [Nitrosomonadales bacterium]